MSYLFGDKVFIRNLYTLALPIILNELLNSLINMMDTFMIGSLGAANVSAVSLGNQVFFIFTLFSFGICSGASIFMGQYYGADDMKGVKKALGIALCLALLNAFVFFILAFFCSHWVMSVYSNDPEVIELGTGYLKIVGFSYFLTAITVTFNAALKATHHAYIPMCTTFLSLVSNVVFNYIFIFIMNMGPRGAALGTVCARSIETVVLISIIFGKKLSIAGKLREYLVFNKGFLIKFGAITLPVILNEGMWGLGTTAYNIAYKYSGTLAQASVQVASVVQNLFVVVGMGIGASAGILVANSLGAKDMKRALDYAKKCYIIAILLSIILGIILAFTSPYIVNIFNIGAEGKSYALKMLYIVSFGITLKTINYIGIVGILRNGGDTVFGLILDAASVWLIGIPMAFLGSKILGLPIYITFAMVYCEELVKMFFSLYRVIIKRKWLQRVI